MSKANYQKLNYYTRAATDNRGEAFQEPGPPIYPPSKPKKRNRWSGERRAVEKYGADKGSFARKHNLHCSSCGDNHPADWAVAKLGKNGKPYGYCLPCYRTWKQKQTSG